MDVSDRSLQAMLTQEAKITSACFLFGSDFCVWGLYRRSVRRPHFGGGGVFAPAAYSLRVASVADSPLMFQSRTKSPCAPSPISSDSASTARQMVCAPRPMMPASFSPA